MELKTIGRTMLVAGAAGFAASYAAPLNTDTRNKVMEVAGRVLLGGNALCFLKDLNINLSNYRLKNGKEVNYVCKN